jgi:hemerythrin superfamily protein
MQDVSEPTIARVYADPAELLHREHMELLRLLRAIPPDHARRAPAIGVFVSELTAHLLAEEEALYPAVQRHVTTIDVHLSNMDKLKRELARVAAGDWSPLPRIRRLITAHARLQEKVLFPWMNQRLLAGDRDRIARALGEARTTLDRRLR